MTCLNQIEEALKGETQVLIHFRNRLIRHNQQRHSHNAQGKQPRPQPFPLACQMEGVNLGFKESIKQRYPYPHISGACNHAANHCYYQETYYIQPIMFILHIIIQNHKGYHHQHGSKTRPCDIQRSTYAVQTLHIVQEILSLLYVSIHKSFYGGIHINR